MERSETQNEGLTDLRTDIDDYAPAKPDDYGRSALGLGVDGGLFKAFVEHLHDGFILRVMMGCRPETARSQPLPELCGEASSAMFAIISLEECSISLSSCPKGMIQFYVPRIGDAGPTSSVGPTTQPAAFVVDPLVTAIGNVLAPFLASRNCQSDPLKDQLISILLQHVNAHYPKSDRGAVFSKGGLTGWQMRMVNEYVQEHLTGEIYIADIAKLCRLSVSHFARAFRESTGKPPHRWLLEKRVQKAKTLMKIAGQTLTDIAAESGFNDQSHFTRVFTSVAGVSPGRWRRAALMSNVAA